MRKTKSRKKISKFRRKKISKFTYKKKAGMLALRSMLGLTPTGTITITPKFKIEDAFQILDKITSLILNIDYHDMVHIKNEILRMTSMVKELSDSDKIAFINRVNTTFNEFHNRDPAVMELYFTQIITIIDANLSDNFLSFESRQISELCNASMKFIVNAFKASSSATQNTLTPRSIMRKYYLQDEEHIFGIKSNIRKVITSKDGFDMNVIKPMIFKMTNMFKEVTNRDKIAFIEGLYYEFIEYYERNPVAMELYFTQIITIIDTILGDIFLSPESSRLAKIANFLRPEVLQLIKLSHDTMVMIVTKTQSSLSVPLEIAQRSSLSVPLEIAQRSSQSAPIALLGSRMSAPRE